MQCVHVVTDLKLRPDIPTEENLPGPEGKRSFSGFAEYVELMQQCWDSVSFLDLRSEVVYDLDCAKQ